LQRSIAIKVVAALVLFGGTAPAMGEESVQLRVGVAQTDITWHVGNERLGPALAPATSRPLAADPLTFAGLHSRVYAKAVVVSGPEPFAIVRADILMITGDLYESVAQRVARATDIPPERLLLAATHTHVANSGLFPHPVHGTAFRSFDPREKEFIAARIAKAVEVAARNLRPASLGVGSGYVSLPAFNRREPQSNDLSRLDPELGILRFEDAATGEPIAVIMNYGLHPVVLINDNAADDQPLASADFVGFAERDLERALTVESKAPMAIWFTGAVGDQEPVYVRYSYPEAEWTGRIFAAEAARVANGLRPEPLLRARVAEKLIPLPEPGLPSTNDLGGPRVPVAGAPVAIPSSARLQAIELATASDKTVLLGWPGEPIRDIGVSLKQRARTLGFDHVFVLGLADEWAGYWLTPEQYDLGGYERLLAFYGRTSSTYVEHHVIDLAASLATGNQIERVELPPQALADRATTAEVATLGIEGEHALEGSRATLPDLPLAALDQPKDVSRPDPVWFTWRGGSPEVARDFIPRVSLQRRVGGDHVTVATEGTGEVLLFQVTPQPGDSRWTAVWQPLFDTQAGSYRFSVEGRRKESLDEVSYTLDSEPFEVRSCGCLEPAALLSRPSGDGSIQLSVVVDYPTIAVPDEDPEPTDAFRLLPDRVSTGSVFVDVVREGSVVGTITLSFVSRVELVTKTVARTHPAMTILEPTERGSFEATWTGAEPVSFQLAGVVDAFGNTD
jgi:hypothetical protein